MADPLEERVARLEALLEAEAQQRASLARQFRRVREPLRVARVTMYLVAGFAVVVILCAVVAVVGFGG